MQPIGHAHMQSRWGLKSHTRDKKKALGAACNWFDTREWLRTHPTCKNRFQTYQLASHKALAMSYLCEWRFVYVD